MKPCAVCSAPFEPGSNRALYCSAGCKAEARRARAPRLVPPPPGNRREGFRVVIDGVEGRWFPRYNRENRDRLPAFAFGEELLAMGSTYDGSKSGGAIDRFRMPRHRDSARAWALEEHGVDIGAPL